MTRVGHDTHVCVLYMFCAQCFHQQFVEVLHTCLSLREVRPVERQEAPAHKREEKGLVKTAEEHGALRVERESMDRPSLLT